MKAEISVIEGCAAIVLTEITPAEHLLMESLAPFLPKIDGHVRFNGFVLFGDRMPGFRAKDDVGAAAIDGVRILGGGTTGLEQA